MLVVIVVGLVFFSYYGGDNCPRILKDNKKVLLGLLIGLFMGKFMSGYSIVEGLDDSTNVSSIQCPEGKDFYFTENVQGGRRSGETDVELATRSWYAQGAGAAAVKNICRVGGQASGCPAGHIRARGEESPEKCSPCGQISHTRRSRVWREPKYAPGTSVTEYKDKIDKVPNPEGTECICPPSTQPSDPEAYPSCVDKEMDSTVKVLFQDKTYPMCGAEHYKSGGSCANKAEADGFQRWGQIVDGTSWKGHCICFDR